MYVGLELDPLCTPPVRWHTDVHTFLCMYAMYVMYISNLLHIAINIATYATT
jgi:hypothetical protein